jgi:hypothetical protein
MSCTHCGANGQPTGQRGRYCVGCGRLLSPSPLPLRRVHLAPRPPYPLPDDATQPVLRFRVTTRRPLPVEQVVPAPEVVAR